MSTELGDRSGARLIVLSVVFVVIFAVNSIQLFRLQVLSGDLYISRAQNIAKQSTVIPSQRGEIYARDYSQPLVFNTDSFAVSIIPGDIKRDEMSALISRLALILDMPRDQIDRRLPPNIYTLFQPVEVAVNISFEKIALLAEQMDSFPGVSWKSKPKRSYSELGSLSHIIGYVGDITRDELTVMYNRGYQQGDTIGKNGIERQYDEILRGKDGLETRIVDARGRRIAGENTREPPVMGKNLVLTIDGRIQTLAEKALGPRIGAVVVSKPSTGEILAMVSYPYYDPDIFNQSDLAGEYRALLNDPDKPLINRAIQSSYPPASTFKVVMTTGILNERAFSPETRVECPGEITYGDRLWRCHLRRPGHGRLNLHNAMAQSCDIYYWIVGRDYLRVENIVNYSREYGYGEMTGIDIPGENAGFIPTPQWKERRLHERWQGGDTMNMSIGQGFSLVTPLQMNNMASMVANKGVIYKPHFLKEIRDPKTGAVETTVMPEVLRRSDIERSVFENVAQDMRGVITVGTAVYPMNIRAVEIAGKTGTAEVGLPDNWHSWFTSFAPFETNNPDERVAVTVIVEAANNWEWWAPYCSAIIYQGIFANQTYEESVRALGLQYLQAIQGRRE